MGGIFSLGMVLSFGALITLLVFTLCPDVATTIPGQVGPVCLAASGAIMSGMSLGLAWSVSSDAARAETNSAESKLWNAFAEIAYWQLGAFVALFFVTGFLCLCGGLPCSSSGTSWIPNATAITGGVCFLGYGFKTWNHYRTAWPLLWTPTVEYEPVTQDGQGRRRLPVEELCCDKESNHLMVTLIVAVLLLVLGVALYVVRRARQKRTVPIYRADGVTIRV